MPTDTSEFAYVPCMGDPAYIRGSDGLKAGIVRVQSVAYKDGEYLCAVQAMTDFRELLDGLQIQEGTNITIRAKHLCPIVR